MAKRWRGSEIRWAWLAGVLITTLLLAACGNAGTTPAATAGQGAGQPTATAAATMAPTAAPTSAATKPPASTPAPTVAATAVATAAVTPAATASPAGPPQTLAAYLLQNGKVWPVHRQVDHTVQTARASLNELLSGPNQRESAANLTTSIPSGTKLNNVTIANGVATVDLSAEFAGANGAPLAAVGQVVYTLTQFSNVQSVTISVAGKPLSVQQPSPQLPQAIQRADLEDVTPAILIESPAFGDTVSSPAHVTGTANVFEAQFVVQVVDAQGNVLKEQQVHATSGTGTRGTFDVQVPFSVSGKQAGKIVAYDLSAKDGSKIDVVAAPVTLTP